MKLVWPSRIRAQVSDIRRWPEAASRAASRLRTDLSAVTAVEFAILAMPFFGLLFVIAETCYIAFVQNVLEETTKDAGRKLMTGRSANISNAAQFLSLEVCPSLPAFLSCSSMTIQVRQQNLTSAYQVAANNGGAFLPLPATPLFCPGRPGSTTLIDVAYNLDTFTNFLPTSTGSTSRQLVAHYYFKNEPAARQGQVC